MVLKVHIDVLEDVLKALKHVTNIIEEINNTDRSTFKGIVEKEIFANPHEANILEAVMKSLALGTMAKMMTEKNTTVFGEGKPKPSKCDNDCENCETHDELESFLQELVPQKKKENSIYI